MKQIFTLLIVTICMLSCSDEEIDGDKYAYSYTNKSDLIISTSEDSYMKFGTVASGENLVFEYRFNAEDDAQIADDEYGETIRFEIDEDLNEFSYSNTELATMKLVFSRDCFCYFPMDVSKNVEPTGSISGQKISDKQWNIKIDVTFYGEDTRTIEERFTLKQ